MRQKATEKRYGLSVSSCEGYSPAHSDSVKRGETDSLERALPTRMRIFSPTQGISAYLLQLNTNIHMLDLRLLCVVYTDALSFPLYIVACPNTTRAGEFGSAVDIILPQVRFHE